MGLLTNKELIMSDYASKGLANGVGIPALDHIYQDISEDSHATEEEVHTIKKCLEILHNVHDLRHLSKM